MNNELKHIGIPYAFRYRPDNDYVLDEIQNHYIYFANRDQLNDPFDSSPNYLHLTPSKEELNLLKQEILKGTKDPLVYDYIKRKDGVEYVQKIATDKLGEFILSFGIACFSMHQINYNLWANYANNHKGLCLQYNIDYDLKFFHNLLPVFYVPELTKREFKPITQSNGIVDLLYHKLEDWSSEKELRLIKDRTGKIYHDRQALRNIIIGQKAEQGYIEKILSIVKNNYTNIGVYQMKKPKETHKASYILLNNPSN
ncbi:Protein of unknown function (DUF2971) [Gillisia sp. Hel_I_86]|uniref:DUF2971 domain-containing protein n=1 Tax=Gillisia sp. Hel_I_86 TaxID=1249981 RepID=UPI00119945B1|nr:DUF2971 domain-containing protein [Gillisia sp. Hel_I_86]TVZ26768.1 Protein of unknown function (DUF2971) [Gillisia sp. Hel_I_86]